MNITKKLSKWMSNNELQPAYIFVGEDYYYNCISEEITISKEIPEMFKLYKSYSKLNCYNLCDHTICFLHEVGHIETIDYIPEIIYSIDMLLRGVLETESSTNFTRYLKASIYYRLPVESSATKWMKDFIRNYPEEVKELDKIFKGDFKWE